MSIITSLTRTCSRLSSSRFAACVHYPIQKHIVLGEYSMPHSFYALVTAKRAVAVGINRKDPRGLAETVSGDVLF